ncbi:MAG: type III PLP-dependent enzyme, partial [Stackebrandtia sp.]
MPREAAAPPPRVAKAIAALPRPVCGYVYDLSVLSARVRRVREALPAGAVLLYAMKANSRPAVVARA